MKRIAAAQLFSTGERQIGLLSDMVLRPEVVE